MNIRLATNQEKEAIQQVHTCAFPLDESELIAKLAIDLLLEKSSPKVVTLVAEFDGAIVGHVAFSPVGFRDHKDCLGYILAPLGVKPDFQHRGIGSQLIEHGIQLLTSAGVNIVLVYGDPEYYCRFGFSADRAARFKTPYALQYPFGWQALEIADCNINQPWVEISCVEPLCHAKLW